MDNELIIQAIVKQGMLPLYYHATADVSIAVTKALYRAGIRVVEYTNRGENAVRNFELLKAERDNSMPGLLLGVGTIKTPDDARKFISLEADFIISPGTIPSIGLLCNAAAILWIPGCMTPTEIILAEESGATLVKLFPGNILGPGYVSTIKEIFPNLIFMATGGVDTTKENLKAWFTAGVSAVGMGSKLISKTLLEKADYAGIEEQTVAVRGLIESIRE